MAATTKTKRLKTKEAKSTTEKTLAVPISVLQQILDEASVAHWQKEISGQVKAIAKRLQRLKRTHGTQSYFSEVERVKLQLTRKDVELLNQFLQENSRSSVNEVK